MDVSLGFFLTGRVCSVAMPSSSVPAFRHDAAIVSPRIPSRHHHRRSPLSVVTPSSVPSPCPSALAFRPTHRRRSPLSVMTLSSIVGPRPHVPQTPAFRRDTIMSIPTFRSVTSIVGPHPHVLQTPATRIPSRRRHRQSLSPCPSDTFQATAAQQHRQ